MSGPERLPPGPGTRMRGRVVAFDDGVGLGTVGPTGGGPAYGFHCTRIADGSRHIDPGVEVDFEVVAGRNGAWEATAVRPYA